MLMVGDRILPGFLFAAQAEGEKGDGEGKFERARKKSEKLLRMFFCFSVSFQEAEKQKNCPRRSLGRIPHITHLTRVIQITRVTHLISNV